MAEELRVCRKCLLKKQSEEQYFQSLENYIANLDEEDRVDQSLYEKRLTVCGQCPNLTKGMCRICGCFVELRAALKVRRCPDVKRRW